MSIVINRVFEAFFDKIANDFSGEDFTAKDLMKLFNEYGKDESDSDTDTKKKKKKDPNAPKMHNSAYIHYGQINRMKIISIMNEEYDKMSPDDLSNKADEIFKKVKKDKDQKISDWIAKPQATQTEIMKRCGIEWKNLSEKKMKRYKDVAEKDKVRYTTEIDKYKLSDDYKNFNK